MNDPRPQAVAAAPDLQARVEALLAEPGYASLLGAIRERLEAVGQPASVTLRDLDPAARRALADLLGRRQLPRRTVTVRVDEIDRSLLASRVGAGLVDLIEAVGGPLSDRREHLRRSRAAWKEVVGRLEARTAGRSELAAWLEDARRDGLLARFGGDPDGALRLAGRALDVLERLPAGGEPLSVLAAETTGDPHGLDPGTPLATLALRGAAALVGRNGLPTGARERRRLWSEVGVVCDPLSSSVLLLGLRAAGIDLIAGTLDEHADFGEPLRLTLRQLHNTGRLPYGRDVVSICENPAVVAAAADAHAENCRPLVCVEGMPDAAADRLLRDLTAAGCQLRFHADLDWGGIRIGNVLAQRYGAQPWRMHAGDYEAAVARTPSTSKLRGAGSEAAWDPGLAPAMRRLGRRIAEEQVLADLLTDLEG